LPAVSARIELVLDCRDPDRLVAFWCAALGYREFGRAGQYRSIVPDAGDSPKLIFQAVPETKAVKNRMHLDLIAGDIEAEAERLLALGATRTSAEAISEHGARWITMTDPEGNEFCICAA